MDLVDKFVKRILNYSQEDTEKISAAAVYAAKKHGDQRRKSGEPYLIHPIAVAEILISYNMDADTVCAGLLHDTIEDTETTEEDIAKASFTTPLKILKPQRRTWRGSSERKWGKWSKL